MTPPVAFLMNTSLTVETRRRGKGCRQPRQRPTTPSTAALGILIERSGCKNSTSEIRATPFSAPPSRPTHRPRTFKEALPTRLLNADHFPLRPLPASANNTAFKCLPEVPTEAFGRPFKTGACAGLAPVSSRRFRNSARCREIRCTELPALVEGGVCSLAMRPQLLRGAARCLWARKIVSPARRHLNCGSLPLEELFARGGPLRTFLERQAGSEAQLQVRGSELLATAKLLSEKERELQETEHLLHGEGRARGNGTQNRFLTLYLLFLLCRRSGVHTSLGQKLFTQLQPGLVWIRGQGMVVCILIPIFHVRALMLLWHNALPPFTECQCVDCLLSGG